MRLIPFLVSALLTLGLVWALNRPWGDKVPMPMGKFLSPQTGFWQNAEASDYDYSEQLDLPELKGKVDVYFDERLVPHIFASNDDDLYFVQGYLHAKFRLFQMDLQTKAAEGRASEIAGEKAVNYDREQRRLGMRYAAEIALKEMEKDPASLAVFTAYTNGVNAYIETLTESTLPLEYKILNFQPEKWSNIRTALLLKMMAKMLSSGTENDLGYTNARSIFTESQFDALYPQVPDSLAPIVPKGTLFDTAGIKPVKPLTADSLYFGKQKQVAAVEISKPDKSNGSNNWVVAGSKTQSGAPILSNDPHLELSLPSIWFEQQLTTPTHNVYGVSLPGSPFVIIGFNDSLAWGVTNAGRDVKDYFEIKFKDRSRQEYWYNNQWTPTTLRIENIKVKGGTTVIDTVAYTTFGPVMFDETFSNVDSKNHNLAVRWAAYEPGNDGWTFYKLNRANNYDDYVNAISTFKCPGQNFVFASKSGDIAIWQQGQFPARWKGQGMYIMPGEDTSYNWQGFIPQAENPHSRNPVRGFLESANQRAVDSTYPYFIPGEYITPRGVAIEHYLNEMSGITPADMMKLQNNYYNTIAADMMPILLRHVDEPNLTAEARKYLESVRNWDYFAGPDSKAQTVFASWWDTLQVAIWKDDIERVSPAAPFPEQQTTLELLSRDDIASVLGPVNPWYIDDPSTPEVETLTLLVTRSINKAATFLAGIEQQGKLEWYKFKNPSIYHLLKNNLLPFAHQGLHVGGSGTIINAVTHSHGPSWRMVAQMGAQTEAYGVYPGGQNGNPGSKYYDNFIRSWEKGEYYLLWVMKPDQAKDARVKWTMAFQ